MCTVGNKILNAVNIVGYIMHDSLRAVMALQVVYVNESHLFELQWVKIKG